MPKMLCLDLDETLLMPDLTIPAAVTDALRSLVRRGVVVTLATGRMFPSAAGPARRRLPELRADWQGACDPTG